MDAWAPGAEEGRGKRRYAPGSRKRALIRGSPNGATRRRECSGIAGGIHTPARGTGGSETSQYPEEEKSTEIPQVAASERGGAQTRLVGKPAGVAGRGLQAATGWGCGPIAASFSPSRRGLEGPATERDSRVGEGEGGAGLRA